MEPINAALLPLVEAFGTRNQEFALSDGIVPTFELTSTAFASMQLVGADTTGPLTASGAISSVGVTVQDDCYVTGIWFREPAIAGTAGSCLIIDSFVQRPGISGTPFQITALWPQNNLTGVGRALTGERTFPLQGLPWGTLLRAGDLISIRILNGDAAAFTGGIVLAYRGFRGPPP